jgi:two-component system, cell cycle sensor histidine kinase and response regulator CckA
LVRELMVYSGQDDAHFEPVDVAQLVKEMLQLLKVSISKQATLRADLPRNLSTVSANPAQIRQVVMNLITNASEALGEKEGTISISLAQTRLENSLSSGGLNPPKGEYLRLTVCDTGCGMTEDIKSRIFDPFFTTKFAGRGLGLAGVQGIVHSHGGAINVASAPGQGTRFELLMPCSDRLEGDKTAIGAAASASQSACAGGTVLVVEDEEVLRVATSKMLRKAGFSVLEAGDGATGLALFMANRPEIDVVLLDMTLPGMPGREVMEEMRRVQPDIKVIVTTAYSEDRAASAVGGEHRWHFIRKPYQLCELTGLLRNVIGK